MRILAALGLLLSSTTFAGPVVNWNGSDAKFYNSGSVVAPSGLSGHGAITLDANRKMQSIAPGSSGNILTSNGTDWVSQAAAAGFTNPMTTWGDLIFENSSPAPARLAGNTTTTKKYLSQTGTGSISADPVWSQPAFSELSGQASLTTQVSGVLPEANGGTNQSTYTLGDILYSSA